jgi:hypothetical protein
MESIEILKRKIKREKAARLEAERLLEEKSRELYDKGQMLEERSLQLFAEGQKLEKLNSTLETRVAAGMLKLQRSNAMLTTLHETVLMAAEVDTFDEALERCLNAICHLSGWPLGHIYKRVNDGEDSLLSSGIWYLEKPDLFKGFREVTALTKYKRGVGFQAGFGKRVLPSGLMMFPAMTTFSERPQASGLRSAVVSDFRSRSKDILPPCLNFLTMKSVSGMNRC